MNKLRHTAKQREELLVLHRLVLLCLTNSSTPERAYRDASVYS